jgi:hypothetical protein
LDKTVIFYAQVIFTYLDGATPIKFGPRPFHNADIPSFWIICLKKRTEKCIGELLGNYYAVIGEYNISPASFLGLVT